MSLPIDELVARQARAFPARLAVRAEDGEASYGELQALIDVYDDGKEGSQLTQHYVRRARLQHALLSKRVERYIGEGRKLIEARLQKADALAATDPESARRMYRGVVELYGENGAAVVDYDTGETRYRLQGDDAWTRAELAPSDRFVEELKHFAALLRGEAAPRVTGHDGLRAVEVIHQAYANRIR